MKHNKYFGFTLLILCLAFAGLASLNLFTNNGFSFHDETQIANLFEYNKVISQGQFPPRWSPDVHFTYGSPYPEFNYQLPYYFGVIFHKIGFSLLDSYKLVLALSLILGAGGMFLLGRSLAGPLGGFVSSLLFTFTPYRAVDVYVRGTIGESLAIGIFPWIVWALYRLRKTQNFQNLLFSSISISSLILTHQPSTAFGLPIILFIFIFSELLSKNYKYLLSLLASLVVAICLSAYYLIPLFLEQKFIQPVTPFNFYDHFPFIKQLIYSRWDYGVSIEGPYDGLSFQIGLANLAVIFTGSVFLLVTILKKRLKANIYLLITFLGILAVLFCMNIRSSFLWSSFSFTNSIQFPWRLLAIMALLTSLLYLFLLVSLKGLARKLLLVIIPIIALISSFSYFHPGTIVDHDDSYYLRRYLPNQVLFKGEKVSADYLNYTENYLPLPLKAVRPQSIPENIATATQSETIININKNDPFSVQGNILSGSGDFITIHRFFYPGWTLKIDGDIREISIGKNGAMIFFVDKGTHTFDVSFQDTVTRRISNFITLITLVSSTLILIYYSTRKRVY